MSRPSPAVNAHAATSGAWPALLVLAACFALSGVAALIYQIAWTRQFAIVFGTSELAVATVLAAYMGGLAFGAWIAERFLSRIERPVLTYALLELGIAIGALAIVPLLIAASSHLLIALFGHQPTPPSSEQFGLSLYYLASAFVALAVPTTLMGATLPVLARHAVRADVDIGRRIGLLYAVNTAGAVCGALLAGFVLLPALGLRGTLWVGVALNLLVFVLAAGLTRVSGASRLTPLAAAPRRPLDWRQAGTWILPMMLLSGAITFASEVLWTRMLSHVVGSSLYAFAVMLASFLSGIAIGGGAAAWIATTRERASRAFALTQLGIALSGLAAWIVLERAIPEKAGLLGNAFFGFTLLLPLTLFIGATFPLAVRILARDAADAAGSSARVYAWNTMGAIIGAIGAGFLLIPALRLEGTMRVLVSASALLSVAAIWRLGPAPRWLLAGLTASAAGLLVFFRPDPPHRLLITSPLNVPAHGDLLFYGVGRSATVVVLGQDGGLALRTNGLPEALMDTPGISPRFSGEFWMSPLAVLARPATKEMLVIGYGGGVVVEGVPPSVAHIDVIELEPEVMAANAATRSLRRRDPLADPRMKVITNDARGAMRLTDRRYDAIVSQPSHPWTAGASHLYTREFLELSKARLADDGIFVQWMNLSFLDEELLRSLTATLLSVFGEVRVYRPDPSTLVFLASDAPIEPERLALRADSPIRQAPVHYSRFGIESAEDLVTALVLDAPGARALATGARPITDDDNRLATSSVYELGRGLTPDAAGRVLAAYDPLQRPDSFVFRELRDVLALDYIARRMTTYAVLDPSLRDRLARMSQVLAGTGPGAYAAGLGLAVAGRPVEAQRLYRESLASHPDYAPLRYEIVRAKLGPIARGEADPEILEHLAALPPLAQATVRAVAQAAHDEWPEIAAMDATLAEVRWTDPWAFEALQVRADWRTHVSTPQRRRALGDQALALLDRMIVVQPTSSMYALRARAALTAERPDVLVESIASYSQAIVSTGARLSPNEKANARQILGSMSRLLDQTRERSKEFGPRIAQVEEKLDKAVATLG